MAFTQWWEYALVALFVFFTCLTLNYIVKRINEAHHEERLIRQRQKSPTSQSTQVQGPLIEIETRGSAGKVEATPQMKELDNTKSEDNVENTPPKFLGAICITEDLSTSRDDKDDSKKSLSRNRISVSFGDASSTLTTTPQMKESDNTKSEDNAEDTTPKFLGAVYNTEESSTSKDDSKKSPSRNRMGVSFGGAAVAFTTTPQMNERDNTKTEDNMEDTTPKFLGAIYNTKDYSTSKDDKDDSKKVEN